MVPLVTVMLAVFSAFPMFASFQSALEKYFLQGLVPEGIAKPVLGALTQFAAKATRLGALGPDRAGDDGPGADVDDRPRPQRHLARAPPAADRAARAGVLGRH